MLTGGIGFFDSGVGGLTVLKECRVGAFGLPVYYYGDNLRAPYGNRPIYEIRAYAHEAFEFFRRIRVRAAVIACNTVTAVLIDELRREYDFPIVGVEPAVLPAVRECRRVAVLATRATCESARLKRLLERAGQLVPEAEITALPCPRLAEEIEAWCLYGAEEPAFHLPPADVDGVVLGCTHYALIKKRIERAYGAKVFDGSKAVWRRLQSVLQKNGIYGEAKPIFDHFCTRKGKLSALACNFAKMRPKNQPITDKKSGKNAVRFWRVKNVEALYFVGSGRVLNRKFYERMFAFYRFQK